MNKRKAYSIASKIKKNNDKHYELTLEQIDLCKELKQYILDNIEDESLERTGLTLQYVRDNELDDYYNKSKDIKFLTELKKRIDNFHTNGDRLEIDYIKTMVDDWLHELQGG